MAIYKTRLFARWARKEGLGDKSLCQAVEEMSQGLFEANLGGNIFKSGSLGQGKARGAASARLSRPV
jgi:hypothetical protein